MASLTSAPSWSAAVAAKTAWLAEVAISGKNSMASMDLCQTWQDLLKACTEELNLEVPW